LKLLNIGEVDYKQIKNLLQNQYFKYKTNWEFLDYNDIKHYRFNIAEYWYKENIKNIDLKKKKLVIKCRDVNKFALSENELINYIRSSLNFKLLFFDVDTVNEEKKVGTAPLGKLFDIKNFQKLVLTGTYNFFGGHNIINYDVPLLLSYHYDIGERQEKTFQYEFLKNNFIDTLYLSILLNKKASYALKKEYKKKQSQNDPLLDASESYEIFMELCEEFKNLPNFVKLTLFYLLNNNEYFKGFFKYTGLIFSSSKNNEIVKILKNYLPSIYDEVIKKHPVEISLIFMSRFLKKPIARYAYINFKNLSKLEKELTLKEIKSLKNFVSNLLDTDNFEFRRFKPLEENLFGKEISQEEIIKAAIEGENVFAILPTGGGKSLCYQIPAIFDAEKFKQLTLVISPLRSLMKDQIEGFNKKYNTSVKAGALSGFLSPSERSKLIEDVEKGNIDILYIAPEALRFNTIRSILKKRALSRVVIDEAHCISMWGHDFRPDYRYIADFLKEMYGNDIPPISLFSATASKEVIEDITSYFKEKLEIEFKQFIADNTRKNLFYKVIPVEIKEKKNVLEEKYKVLIKLVKPKQIVYIPNSVKDCDEIAKKLNVESGYRVESFHSKKENRDEILDNFINNKIDIIVSTTAFGMGVDKPDIESVIHFTPSQNIEDYMQESGRAGRDAFLVPKAECIVLYYEGDFDKYLHRLKSSIITREEIQAVYQALKDIKKDKIYITPVELALKSKLSIDIDNTTYKEKLDDIIAELTEEGLVKRYANNYNIYATAIEINDVTKVRKLLNVSDDEINLAFALYNLIKKKSKTYLDISEASFLLGRKEKEIIEAIRELKEKGIISDDKEIHFEVNKPVKWVYFAVERFLVNKFINNNEEILKLREIADLFKNCEDEKFKKYSKYNNKKIIEILENILNSWKEFAEIKRVDKKLSIWKFNVNNLEKFQKLINLRLNRAYNIYKKILQNKSVVYINEIKNEFGHLSEKEINDILVYLHYAKAITLKDGVLVYYPQYVLEVTKFIPRYTNEMYEKRKKPFYDNKRKKIHVMNEYLIKQIKNEKTSEFLKNYFLLPLNEFIKKYVEYVKQYIEYFITATKYQQLFESLSDEQKRIILSKKKQIMVLAGPGSGKTKTLVNKIAHIVLNNEKVNPELFLMLTYTRTAMLEFKERLYNLIGNEVYKLDIHTFHSYLYYILGENTKSIDNHESDSIFDKFLNLSDDIKKDIVPVKFVLYLDEYQDITPKAFEVVKELIKYGSIKEIVAVGDDDQMIMDFTGSSVEFFDKFWELSDVNVKERVTYTLSKNFRSATKIVRYANEFVKTIRERKKSVDIIPVRREKGELEIVEATSPNLYEPIVRKIIDLGAEKEIAILTHNNDNALTLKTILNNKGIESKLILDKPKFKWINIYEIKEFDKYLIQNLKDNIINDEVIRKSYNQIAYLSGSKNFYLIDKIISFLKTKEEITYEDWRSLLEDLDDEFFNFSKSNIVISTIHKAKGKEFENVILMDEENQYNSILNDNLKRKYYVAITRAKNGLYIFTNHKYFYNDYAKNNLIYKYDKTKYRNPNEMILEFGLEDINLGASFYYQKELQQAYLNNLKLILQGDKIKSANSTVAQLSKKGIKKLGEKLKKGYNIKSIELTYLINYFTKNYNTNETKEILQGVFNIELTKGNINA